MKVSEMILDKALTETVSVVPGVGAPLAALTFAMVSVPVTTTFDNSNY